MSAPLAPPLRSRLRLLRQALIAACVAVLLALPLGARLDPLIGDLVTAGLGPHPSASEREQIVVIAITEDTLADFPYRSPIDRGFLAALIERLDKAGARAIGIDILFDQPSEAEKDKRLFAAIDAASAPVVLAAARSRDGLTERQAAYVARHVLTRRAGLIVLERDEIDGTVRHLPRLRDGEEPPIPGFAQALATATGASAGTEAAPGRILYAPSPPGAPDFALYPAHAAALLPDDWFAGKYVLIGTDLPDIDRHPTPLGTAAGSAAGTRPGIVIHAHILAQVLTGVGLPTLPALATPLLAVLVALASALLFSLPGSPRLPYLLLALGLVLSGIASWMLVRSGTLLPPLVAPTLAAIASALALSLWRWIADRADRAFLRTAFAHYVSPAVVRRLASGDLKLALGGEKREVTYLFTDLEGFTGLSEQLPPAVLVGLLNEYLDAMCGLMTDHGATIDKIIGDAVVGFFGAPDADPEQARHAVELALAIDAFAEDHRRQLAARGIALGVTRIGIHRGEAVIGNFGGSRFFDYTGIGDTVNTAARLEGANRYLGTRICVSETVAGAAPDLSFRPAGELVLKGRKGALACFEPLPPERADSDFTKAYKAAFGLMRDKSDAATAAFEAALRLAPDDPLARLHAARLRAGEEGATLVLAGK